MFIIKFQGALGNQMFEYAFLKKMQMEYPGCDFEAHIPNIKDFNGFELERVFNHIKLQRSRVRQVEILSHDYPDAGRCYGLMNILYKIRRIFNGPKSTHLRQDDNTFFYPQVFNLNPLQSYYLEGVWANAKYLEGIEEILRNSFVFSENRGEKNDRYLKEINQSNSVCIHVRRNEYVKMGLSVVSDDYYSRAVRYMLKNIEKPKFFVFSDDHEYCKELFNGMIEYTLVEGNTKENSFRDMELMSHCRHNIIANSTFSFWGAFLNENPEKIVIAPNITWGKLRCPFACEDWMIMEV